MKKLLFFIFYLVTTITLASGNRALHLNFNTIINFQEVDLPHLSKRIKYLGSTKQWHFLGKTLTSVSGGMPYDKTFGYKIKKEKIKILNGWELNFNELQYMLYVPNCPAIYFNKTVSILEVTVEKNSKSNCISQSTSLYKI